MPLTVAFFGSGGFAAFCLERLSASIKPEWVVTNAPKPAGRGMELRPTAVQLCAEKLSIPCMTTEKLSKDTELLLWIEKNVPDVMLVIDFGHLIKEPLLSMARLGCINVHPSKLPQYRGSAPVQRAVMDGLEETAVTIFRLDCGMDSGPVLAQIPIRIEKDDTTGTLLKKCAEAGTDELARYLCCVRDDEWHFTPQPMDGVSQAPKIDKSEGRVEWGRTACELSCLVRALAVSPGVFCVVKGKRLRLHEVAVAEHNGKAGRLVSIEDGMPVIGCGVGALRLLRVQPEGKKAQNADEWLRGSRLEVGDTL